MGRKKAGSPGSIACGRILFSPGLGICRLGLFPAPSRSFTLSGYLFPFGFCRRFFSFVRSPKDSIMTNFPRVERLPPYVFNITGELKTEARRRGGDISD